ncbi:hypothetical protein FQR65_LT13403 [Abscondita terminalis]|nr:hypothetical protein FQR65_LT13403 [Abscondita terminalis]
MAENNVNLKIFLQDDEHINEIRRISVDASVATCYLFMKEKLETVFPNLRNAEYKITWKDIDGDEITIANDEDFITAFTELTHSKVKDLTIKIIKRRAEPASHANKMNEDIPQPVICCDGCDKFVTGVRYKCLQCPDFDLCGSCEFQGLHPNHVMVRLPNNESYSSRCARKFMHHIARNMKKAAHHTSKDAYRAAKHASKYSTKCGKQGENFGTAPDQRETDPSQGCPFNLKDLHAWGNMAKENLTQLLEAIPTDSQTHVESGKTDNQGTMVFDMLRNAVDTFFGHPVQNQHTPNNSAEKRGENEVAPMDTDVSPSLASAPLYPQVVDVISIESNSKASTPQNGRVEESVSQPPWTFVAANPQQTESNVQEPSQESQEKISCIYHDNPIIAEGLVKLHEMGFSNESGVLSTLLEHFNGNVTEVVKAIFDNKV